MRECVLEEMGSYSQWSSQMVAQKLTGTLCACFFFTFNTHLYVPRLCVTYILVAVFSVLVFSQCITWSSDDCISVFQYQVYVSKPFNSVV